MTRASVVRSSNKAARRATCPLINARIIAAANAGDVAWTLQEVELLLPEMNLVNLATALHRLARLAENDPEVQAAVWRHPVLPRLIKATSSAFDQAEARGTGPKSQALSNTIWALATLQVMDLPLFRQAARMGHERVSEFKPFEISAILWSFAKLRVVGEGVCEGSTRMFETFANHVTEHVEDYSFQCLLMIASSFATVGFASQNLFQRIATKMAPMLRTARCKDLCSAARSFSLVGASHEVLFSELAKSAMQQLEDFKPEELSLLLHSFASLGIRNQRLLEAGTAALRRMDLQTEHLTMALAHLRPRHKATSAALVALLPRCTQLLGAFKPEELSSVALVASQCFGGRRSEERGQLPMEVAAFFEAASSYVTTRLSEFSGHSLAEITAAYSQLGVTVQSGLFSMIAREVMPRVATFDDSDLLLLLRHFTAVPRCTWVHGTVCMLFREAAMRVDHMREKQFWDLAKICHKLASLSEEPSREEVHFCCQAFAAQGTWASCDTVCQAVVAQEANDEGHGQDASVILSANNPAQGPVPAPLAVVQDFTACKDDAAATEVFRQCVETAAALSDEKAAVQLPADVSDRLARAHVVCSVKNTFLDVVESSSEESEGEGECCRPLAPALDFITPEVSAEKLEAYRLNYQRFRIGMANGAKGEMADFVCDTL